jgi:hypothetical protein
MEIDGLAKRRRSNGEKRYKKRSDLSHSLPERKWIRTFLRLGLVAIKYQTDAADSQDHWTFHPQTDVLAQNAADLAIVPVQGLYWNDLDDPRRVYETLARMQIRPGWMTRRTAPNRNDFVRECFRGYGRPIAARTDAHGKSGRGGRNDAGMDSTWFPSTKTITTSSSRAFFGP